MERPRIRAGGFYFSRGFAARSRALRARISLLRRSPLLRPARQNRHATQAKQWKKERKFRFTASKFDLISKRQRNHKKFAVDLINPKPFTSRYVEHGIKYEPIAIQEEIFLPVSLSRLSFFVQSGTQQFVGISQPLHDGFRT